MTDIDPAIVEKAAKAIDYDQHRYQVNADDWVPRCSCGWQGDIPYAVTEHEAHLATLALEAVSPLIAAQAKGEALRDAANDIERRINERDRLAAAIERVRELHVGNWVCGNPRHTNPEVDCPDCGVVCEACGDFYPCPTLNKIAEDDR